MTGATRLNAPILSYAQTLRGGGVERVLLRLAGAWIAQGRRVVLALGDASGPLAAELPDGIEIVPFRDGAYRSMAALAEVARDVKPKAIFCPGNHYTGVAALTRLRLGRDCPPIVYKVSNALERADQRGIGAWGYRRWLALHPRFIDHLVAMTPAMQAEALRLTGMQAERSSVIPNPPQRAIPGAAPVPLPEGRFLLGVGRLEPQKRWDRAIAALARLTDREVALVILGEGSARAELTALAERLGVRARVHLPGYAADPHPAIERAAAVVLTSDYEGVPGALAEALALGTPVVATNSSVAVREIVTGPELGSIVGREDAEGLVREIERWLAPGAARPAPVTLPGSGSAEAYLALFDRLAAQRSR